MGNCQTGDGTTTPSSAPVVPELPLTAKPENEGVERGRGYSYSAESLFDAGENAGEAGCLNPDDKPPRTSRSNSQRSSLGPLSPSTSQPVSIDDRRTEDYAYAKGLPVSADEAEGSTSRENASAQEIVEDSTRLESDAAPDRDLSSTHHSITITPPKRKKSVKFMDPDSQAEIQDKIEAEVDCRRQLDRMNIRLSLTMIDPNAKPLKPSWRQIGLNTPPPVLLPTTSPKTRAEMHFAKQLVNLNIRPARSGGSETNPSSPYADESDPTSPSTPAPSRIPSGTIRPDRTTPTTTTTTTPQRQGPSSQRGPGHQSTPSETGPVALPGPGHVSQRHVTTASAKPNTITVQLSQSPSKELQESPNSQNSRRSYLSQTSSEIGDDHPGNSTVMAMTRPSFSQPEHASLKDLLQRVSSVRSTESYGQAVTIRTEIEASPELFSLSSEAKQELKSATAIKQKIRQLERVIKLLNDVLPKVTEMLNIRPKASMDKQLIQEIFRGMDISRNGKITYTEFRHSMRNLNVTDEDRMRQAFNAIDENRDNVLDAREFERNIQEVVNLQHRQLCMTHVIQELLRRVQEKKLSKRLRTDFSKRQPIRLERVVGEDEIDFLVVQMAWIRDHVLVASMSDEQDAKMVMMGSREIQRSLHDILKRLTQRKAQP